MNERYYLETDSAAMCAVCNNTFRKCTCPDIDERLARLAASPYQIFRWCSVCNKHYARCTCPHPHWVFSDSRKPMDEANRVQKLMEEARK